MQYLLKQMYFPTDLLFQRERPYLSQITQIYADKRPTARTILSPADNTDECSRLHYIAEKDSLWLVWFCGLSAIICEICERYLGFFFVD